MLSVSRVDHRDRTDYLAYSSNTQNNWKPYINKRNNLIVIQGLQPSYMQMNSPC